MGRHDEAIAAYEAFAHLKPERLTSLIMWAETLFLTGHTDAALAKLREAIAAAPKNHWPYTMRGVIHVSMQQLELAEADFREAHKLDPDDLYPLIRLTVTRKWQGKTNDEDMRAAAAETDLEQWPGPIVRFVLGDIGADELMAAAHNDHARKQREQQCEAFYFIGDHHLRDGDRKLAAGFFRRSIDTGVRSYIEYSAAVVALRQLGEAS